ncbi:MAG TPA: hypothetical protein VLA77_00375 [Candidatus Saccharimonadales bacterium]|nr:hypothetical protein [Candidatus Saccharimonadales bacterium]
MRRYRLTLVLVAILAAAGCTTQLDTFEDSGLTRNPTYRGRAAAITLVDLPPVASDQQMRVFAESTITQLREQWDMYAYGSVLVHPQSFEVQYLSGDTEVKVSCRAERGVTSRDSRPTLCESVLYVPIIGMLVYWQELQSGKYAGKPEAELGMFVELAAALGDYYEYSLTRFADNVFEVELAPAKNKPLFAQCVAGVLAYHNVSMSGGAVPKPWRLAIPRHDNSEAVALESGYGKTTTVRTCYDLYWVA